MGFEFPLKQCRVWASYTAAPHGFTNVRKGPSLTYPNLYRVKCCRCSSGKFGSMPPLDRSQHFRIKGVPSPTRTTHTHCGLSCHLYTPPIFLQLKRPSADKTIEPFVFSMSTLCIIVMRMNSTSADISKPHRS